MAVLCEAISVIVRRDSIDKFYQGGWLPSSSEKSTNDFDFPLSSLMTSPMNSKSQG